ncbi:hypothetical protein BAL199_21369 [alpha proteobacterium BAL199]|nr:hypothetical protein BAL199_21369 [alpha proteobacterium BAL199]
MDELRGSGGLSPAALLAAANAGIRGESQTDALRLFRERLIHTAAIATARAHSRQLANGLPDPSDMSDLAVGNLLDRLLTASIDIGTI